MTEPYCAVCRRHLDPAARHVELEAETVPEDESDAECHNCGESWNDGEEWDVRHINTPDTIGESWYYECPNCERETFQVGI